MASIMTIRLNKNPGSSWGFRLQGGKDFATPLCIQKVNVGSVAEQAGLQAGDAIVSINNSDALAMRHKEAQDAIVKAGNNFELVVQRGSQIWKPTVTALPETKILSDGVPVATKTSLEANKKSERKIGSNYNCVPRPFPGSFNKSASPSSSFTTISSPYSEIIEETKSENTNGFYSSTPQSFRKNSVEKKSSSVTSHPIFNIDESTLDLTISGTGITLDKEKAKNFLIMTLDKENNVNTINLHKSSSKDFSPVNGNINGNSFRSNGNISHLNISGTSRSPSNSSICSSNSLAGRGVRKLSYGSNCSSVSSASSHDGDNESTNNYQKDTYKPIGTGHNASAAPFQLVNAQYNSPVNIYSEDSIAETLSAQAEVLGKGVLGINFKKYAKEEKIRTDSPTYKLLHGEEEERKPRPVSMHNVSDSVPFQRDVTQEQKGYYNINEKLYCDIHAKQAARSNPPAPNLVPVTVQPGAVPPPGALTAPQASKMKIPSAFQQGGPAFAPAPAPAPAPPQTEVQQSEPQELPEPLPAPVFESTQIQSAVSEVSSQSHVSSQIVENEGVVLPPILNGDTFAPQEEGLLPPQETLENESKPIENGFVEDKQNIKEQEVAAETLPPKDADAKEVVTSIGNGEVSQAPTNDVIETKDIKTDLNNIEPHSEVEKDVPSSVAQESSQVTEIPSQREPSPVVIDEHSQELSQSLPTEPSQETPQEPPHESVQTHLQDNIQEFSEAQTQKSLPELVPEQSSELPQSSLTNNVNSLVHLTEGAISNISHFRSEESRITESKFSSSLVQMSVGNDTATQRAPAPAPAPVKPFAPAPAPAPVAAPVKPASAPSYSTSANPQGFGAPAGDINVRAHIPKKGDVPAPAPITFAPVPAPVPVPISNFGSNTMPKPIPPPGTGGKIGPGGPPARGVPQAPGHRSAPRRGRGVMNQASASRIPVCNSCQRQIRGPFVSALGKTWCPDHFICATTTCKRNIIDMGFVEEKGLLYCENCYESFLAPICGKCDKRIKGDCLNAVGKQFHPECFCCAYCGKVFGSGAFYLEDGLPYCETDWNDLFTTKCVGCNFPIEAGDRWVEALNNNYHSQCFKCSKCNKNLEGQSFFAKGGKPFCKAHAQRGLI